MGEKDKNKDNININLDMGLGKMLGNLKNIVDLVSNLDEEGIKKGGNINFEGNDKMKGVFGFSVKTAGNKTSISSFGNKVKDVEDENIVIDKVREPVVDVFDEEGLYTVIAEIPGVEEKDINVSVSSDIVQINAKTGNIEYEKELLLEKAVLNEVEKMNYNNGILEMKLRKMS